MYESIDLYAVMNIVEEHKLCDGMNIEEQAKEYEFSNLSAAVSRVT
jgi:hypothetical protein